MVQVTFVMEQHLGHRAYYENLRGFIDQVPEIIPNWVPVTYSNPNAFWANWNFLPLNLRGTLHSYLQVRKSLREESADVLFFNTQVPAAIASSLVQRQPYVLSTDITPIQYDQISNHYDHKQDNFGLISKYKHSVNLKLLQHASMLLPWSRWTRDSLIEDYRVLPERIEVVAPGVDLKKWVPRTHDNNNGPLRILFVGGDFYRKGGDMLLEAFNSLPPNTAELHLVTRTMIEQSQNVKVYSNMLPNSPELIALFQSADVFVLPTRAEAFGIAAVEASAVGVPIIATAVGGVTDIVVPDKTGFLIEPDDKIALAYALNQLASQPELRSQLGYSARLRAEKLFDARQNASRVSEILQKIACEGLPYA